MILALNCGSSSLKYALFEGEVRRRQGIVERIGVLGGVRDHSDAVHAAFDVLQDAKIDAVGHRIVHGGPSLFEPVRVDDAILAELRKAIPFAPLPLHDANGEPNFHNVATRVALTKQTISIPDVYHNNRVFIDERVEPLKEAFNGDSVRIATRQSGRIQR